MFLSLLTSVFLSACVGLGAIQEKSLETPKIESRFNAFDNSMAVLNGGYTLKYADDSQQYFTEQLFDHDITVDFNALFNTEQYQSFTPCYFVNINRSASMFGTFDKPTISTISYSSSTNKISIHLTFYETDDFLCTISANDYMQDIDFEGNFDITYLGCAFSTFLNVDRDTKALFDVIFSKNYNEHFTVYNGWYSFSTSGFVHQLGTSTIVGSLTANNTLFMSMDVQNFNTLDVSFGSLNNDFVLIDDNVFQSTNTRVYMNNVLITDIDFVKLNRIGSFTFIPNSESYTLTDLFFDIADTPIYFVTSLFDFEFLGMSFIAGFMGLITIMAMVFILKKVI